MDGTRMVNGALRHTSSPTREASATSVCQKPMDFRIPVMYQLWVYPPNHDHIVHIIQEIGPVGKKQPFGVECRVSTSCIFVFFLSYPQLEDDGSTLSAKLLLAGIVALEPWMQNYCPPLSTG